MHLIIAFAARPSDGGRAAASPTPPALDALVARWAEVRRDSGDDDSLGPPHERALAATLGLHGADGCLPWAAHLAEQDGIAVGTQAWGLLTPVHCRVGNDGVHLADPDELALSDADSRALCDAARPLFDAEGVTLVWGAAPRWYLAHESLHGLACASLDRVIGRNINAWLPRQAAARPWRRLQNEVQMQWHRHPVNEAREAAGGLAVNSFWLSGCGRAQPVRGNGDVRLDRRLRDPALRGDSADWHAAWQVLDTEAIAPLLAAGTRGEPARLTLCGDCSAVELAPRSRAWWQRIGDNFLPRRAVARSLLESL
jgi:hypothetical protein